MKPELAELIENEILTPSAKRFGIDPSSLKSLGGFENYVCEGERDGKSVIMRVSHPHRRTFEEIQAETEFITHLADNGVAVSRPCRSVNDRLIERIEHDGGPFAIACFEKAPGSLVKRTEMTATRLHNRGKLIGELHRATRMFKSSAPDIRRCVWNEEEDFATPEKFLPPEDKIIAERLAEVTTAILGYDRSEENWGLIHFDAHHGNILFDGDQPTLIDFDDAAYDLFVSDLAIPLFYHLLMPEDQKTEHEYAASYLAHVLDGYETAYQLDPRWPELFPLILKRREIVLYIAIFRAMGKDHHDDWAKRYFAGRKERIANRVPFTSFDFARFAAKRAE